MKTYCRVSYLILLFGFAGPAHAWVQQGHALICEAAAYALADQAPFLKNQSFDLAYYCNVPDIIWKRPGTYKTERDEHFMDLEIFKRAMGENVDWDTDRIAFFKKYPKAKDAGTAFWRISELCSQLEKLKTKKLDWLTQAGLLGHYVGDLAQPLHTSENYDGQMTEQKGVHAFYEVTIANEIFPDITSAVFNRVKLDFKEIQSKKEMSCFDLARELATLSHQEVPALLELDKKLGRSDLKKVVDANQAAIIKQMSRGSTYLALMWSKFLVSDSGSGPFHGFNESPKYIVPVGKK